MPYYKLPNVDPVTLESLLDLVTAHNKAEANVLGNGILHLSSVTHCLGVKEQFFRRPLAAEAIAKLLWNPNMVTIRFELLMIIGELCRQEEVKDAAPNPDYAKEVERVNELARHHALFFTALPWFHDVLNEVIKAASTTKGGKETAALAEDLMKALPPKSDSTEAAAKAWGPDAQKLTLDLMFLDERYRQLEYAPFVVRASAWTCSGCGTKKDAEKDIPLNRCAQCKAVFYCSADCQKAHWKTSHKAPCSALKKGLEDGFKRVEGAASAFSLFYYENRAFLFMQRPDMYQGLSFDEYFMGYTPK